MRGPRTDTIGRKLEDLFGPTETPPSRTASGRTPAGAGGRP
jgi:hypothetical protein